MTAENGHSHKGHSHDEIEVDPAVFQGIANLEKDFAKVELSALRSKEFALKPLYTKRNVLCSQIPDFWPSVLMNGPQEFQSIIGDAAGEALEAVKSLNVERYAIKSGTEGEPRSLRFTFEFNKNDWFEDTTVVKEFEFVQQDEDGAGILLSKPVTFKWKKKGKKMNNGLLDLAVDLYKAEEATRLKDGKSGQDLDVVDRASLWQYEKLRETLEKADDDDEMEPSWLDWFGYRGPIGQKQADMSNTKAENGDEGDDEDDEDEFDHKYEVEIFPGGEEVAIALADDLWPNVMDYFMASQQETLEDFDGLDSDEEVSDDESIPDLVDAVDERPTKRQKKA